MPLLQRLAKEATVRAFIALQLKIAGGASRMVGFLHADQNGVTSIRGEVIREAGLAWEKLCTDEEVVTDYCEAADGMEKGSVWATGDLFAGRKSQESPEPGQGNCVAGRAIAGPPAGLRTR